MLISAGGMLQRSAQRRPFAHVALMPQQHDAFVLCGNSLQNLPTPIGAAVIHDDDFQTVDDVVFQSQYATKLVSTRYRSL